MLSDGHFGHVKFKFLLDFDFDGHLIVGCRWVKKVVEVNFWAHGIQRYQR